MKTGNLLDMKASIVKSLVGSIDKTFDFEQVDWSNAPNIKSMLKALPERIQTEVMPCREKWARSKKCHCRMTDIEKRDVPYLRVDLNDINPIMDLRNEKIIDCTQCKTVGSAIECRDVCLPNSFLAKPAINTPIDPSDLARKIFSQGPRDYNQYLTKYVYYMESGVSTISRVKPRKWTPGHKVDIYAVLLVKQHFCDDCRNVRPYCDRMNDIYSDNVTMF
ncbi:hypothetical protein CAEBREN_19815 [Caenorhabditis brenneri]|uniref:Uncharacterized protein n=1 Tax=Caenorhabditis brenneri TaxID=135651 RepID=G0P9F0_CAEBE|nr:hypothetical protein CAEBREN_19815 [Caenorhabditis brenneri]